MTLSRHAGPVQIISLCQLEKIKQKFLAVLIRYICKREDLATISGGSNSLETGPGQDMVIISGGNNNINLGEGKPLLFPKFWGVDDVDTIDLGAGNDTLFSGVGNIFESDAVDGGADYDTLVITQSGVLSLPGGSGLKGIEKNFDIHSYSPEPRFF